MTKETKKLLAALSFPLVMLFAVIWKFSKAYTNLDMLAYITLILLFGFMIYFLIYRAPASNKIYSANTEKEISDMKVYLAANGIRTYEKNMSIHSSISWAGLASEPSLHLVNLNDRDKAIQLIRNRTIDQS